MGWILFYDFGLKCIFKIHADIVHRENFTTILLWIVNNMALFVTSQPLVPITITAKKFELICLSAMLYFTIKKKIKFFFFLGMHLTFTVSMAQFDYYREPNPLL